jgi:hypothetical protein
LIKFNIFSGTTLKWKIEEFNNQENMKGKEGHNIKEIEDKE